MMGSSVNDDKKYVGYLFCGWRVLHAPHDGEHINGEWTQCEGWPSDE